MSAGECGSCARNLFWECNEVVNVVVLDGGWHQIPRMSANPMSQRELSYCNNEMMGRCRAGLCWSMMLWISPPRIFPPAESLLHLITEWRVSSSCASPSELAMKFESAAVHLGGRVLPSHGIRIGQSIEPRQLDEEHIMKPAVAGDTTQHPRRPNKSHLLPKADSTPF